MIAIAWALLGSMSVMAQEGASTAFSHKKHAPLKMKCVQCHATAEREEAASFPAIAQCRVCHIDMPAREIPAERVYLLRDFVVFSHAKHALAKVSCATCHGDIQAADAIKVERPLTMAACVACHRETKATLQCNACHELGH